MEEELIDRTPQESSRTLLWSMRLFLAAVSFGIILAMLLFVDGLGIPHRYISSLLPILFFLCGSSSLIGFIYGFTERQKNKRQALIGIIGNGLLLLTLLGIIVAVFYIISQIRMIY
ncbi:MAG: hypothetical protein HWE22_11530 [Flavobacteriales bacterium]|nr:hypothetical protein [Flavobacteriales bacterium]